jgi:hypothetical protein
MVIPLPTVERLPSTPPYTGRSPAVTFRLGRGELELLAQLEQATGQKRSEIIRAGVAKHLQELLAAIESEQREVPKAS